MPHIRVSPTLEFDSLAVIERLTGAEMNPDLDAILAPLELDFETSNPITTQLWAVLAAAIDAAFAAGLACGLDPAQLLLAPVDDAGAGQ